MSSSHPLFERIGPNRYRLIGTPTAPDAPPAYEILANYVSAGGSIGFRSSAPGCLPCQAHRAEEHQGGQVT